MEFFILGVICAVIGFLVTLLTGKDIRWIFGAILVLPIVVILIVGFFRMQLAPSEALDEIAAETINSIVEHWVKHFLFELGGYIVGVAVGFFVGKRS